MSRVLLTFLLIVPMVSTAFLAVWQRNQMIQVGYETAFLQNKKTLLLRARKELIAELASLSTAERIAQIALEQLQMKPPADWQRVYVAVNEPSHREER